MKCNASRRGAALIEAGLCLALFTPLVGAGLGLAYGASQLHNVAAAVSQAARVGGACGSEEEIKLVAVREAPDAKPEDIEININRVSDPASIRVTIHNYKVLQLTGLTPIAPDPSATYPYVCQ